MRALPQLEANHFKKQRELKKSLSNAWSILIHNEIVEDTYAPPSYYKTTAAKMAIDC